jgi:hypothetical protein
MRNSIAGLQGVTVLSKAALKDLKGGYAPSGCGIKVNGVWHPSGTGAAGTQAFLGQNVQGYDPNNWSPDGFTVYPGGSYTGTVTNWCCDSCWWNQPAVA